MSGKPHENVVNCRECRELRTFRGETAAWLLKKAVPSRKNFTGVKRAPNRPRTAPQNAAERRRATTEYSNPKAPRNGHNGGLWGLLLYQQIGKLFGGYRARPGRISSRTQKRADAATPEDSIADAGRECNRRNVITGRYRRYKLRWTPSRHDFGRLAVQRVQALNGGKS